MKEFIKRTITALFLVSCLSLFFVFFPPIFFSCLILSALVFIIFYEWPMLFNIRSLPFWIIMPLYPILPFALLIALNEAPLYHRLLLELFILVASHDTGSYIIGNLIGSHKIWPSISPQKTWEGFTGGYLCTIVALTLITTDNNASIGWWMILFLSFIICTLAFLGDLFESWLKRRAGIKNSGSILPGHGGLLDRFDGIMFAVFFFYLFKDQLLIILR